MAYCAMASSSLVGTTKTLTVESSAEIRRGPSFGPALRSGSILMPKFSSSAIESRRMPTWFSPTPAVNVMASRRPRISM